jgi:ATP-dependent protease HslVU (ClpYQ) peptidase subunit
MSTVVGVVSQSEVVIGSDTLLMQGEVKLAQHYGNNPKIAVVGDSCVGMTGTAAHFVPLIKALRDLGDDCRLWGVDEIFETFTRVHKRLKDDFFLNPKKQPDDAYEGNHMSVMVANGSGIFGVYTHREVLSFERFWANGSGRPYALGAMYAVCQGAKPEPSAASIARIGLAAAMEFDRATGSSLRLYRFTKGARVSPQEIASD